MPYTLNCPKCHKPFRVRDESVGGRVRCPTCRSELQIPSDLAQVKKSSDASRADKVDPPSLEPANAPKNDTTNRSVQSHVSKAKEIVPRRVASFEVDETDSIRIGPETSASADGRFEITVIGPDGKEIRSKPHPKDTVGKLADDVLQMITLSGADQVGRHMRTVVEVTDRRGGLPRQLSLSDVCETLRSAHKIRVLTEPMCHVFLSAQNTDYPLATNVYDYLTARHINTFFAPVSLPELANSDYREAIDAKLDEAVHMVIVASRLENVCSHWVKAEWGFFINEKRSGRKPGNVLTVVSGTLKQADLPPSLRHYEVIPLDPRDAALERIRRYVAG